MNRFLVQLLLVIWSILIFGLTAQAQINLLIFQPPQPEQPVCGPRGEDPILGRQWHLKKIHAFEAWQYTTGRRDITVAVVDSGVDYNNPDLINAIKRNPKEVPENQIDDDTNGFIDDYIGWSFTNNKHLPWDNNGHGTFISGIIAAEYNNQVGGAGVCPGCSILPVRFINRDGDGDDGKAVTAVRYAIQSGASIINLSFAGEGYDKDLHDAIEEAGRRDILVVVAAGNDGTSNDRNSVYPANFEFDNMITVAGTESDNTISEGSNYGVKKVHVAAPGVDIWGPWNDRKWYKDDGTSYASPIVAGVAGLVRSLRPDLKATQVKQIIMATVYKVPALTNKVASGGIVDAEAALKCAQDSTLSCLHE